VVDWGGVLTVGLDECVPRWAEQDGIDLAGFHELLRTWRQAGAVELDGRNPLHAIERGELRPAEFERILAARLRRLDGLPVCGEGLVRRMFATFQHVPAMIEAVRRVRAHGVRTALLSNSWGNDYPRDGWDELFDVVVISGEVGMRKPEPRIFRHTLERVGCPPGDAVFVDDQPLNVRAAAGLGMIGVLHRGQRRTVRRLRELFGAELAG
jgi:epoxide hydrolase-like predicted phosphatase